MKQEYRLLFYNLIHSSTFKKSPRGKALLSYYLDCVDRGETDNLSETVIAIDVYEKKDFDPSLDSSVRVEFSRFKRKVNAYYLKEEPQAPYRLTFHRGSYIPIIIENLQAIDRPNQSLETQMIQRKFFNLNYHFLNTLSEMDNEVIIYEILKIHESSSETQLDLLSPGLYGLLGCSLLHKQYMFQNESDHIHDTLKMVEEHIQGVSDDYLVTQYRCLKHFYNKEYAQVMRESQSLNHSSSLLASGMNLTSIYMTSPSKEILSSLLAIRRKSPFSPSIWNIPILMDYIFQEDFQKALSIAEKMKPLNSPLFTAIYLALKNSLGLIETDDRPSIEENRKHLNREYLEVFIRDGAAKLSYSF